MAENRYEFRAFARTLGLVEDRLRGRAQPVRIHEATDTYLIPFKASAHSAKLRGEQLDVKTLLTVKSGLEQWTPAFKATVPLEKLELREQAFSLLGAPFRGLETADSLIDVNQTDLVEKIARQVPELGVAEVFKRRYLFTVGQCSAELVELSVNGAWLMSVCVESVVPEAVHALCRELGLDDYPNHSYLTMLRRVLGFDCL
jgi:hypothetical protein